MQVMLNMKCCMVNDPTAAAINYTTNDESIVPSIASYLVSFIAPSMAPSNVCDFCGFYQFPSKYYH